MREDIAKTPSNSGCRPPRCAKSRDALRAPHCQGFVPPDLPGPAAPTAKERAWR